MRRDLKDDHQALFEIIGAIASLFVLGPTGLIGFGIGDISKRHEKHVGFAVGLTVAIIAVILALIIVALGDLFLSGMGFGLLDIAIGSALALVLVVLSVLGSLLGYYLAP